MGVRLIGEEWKWLAPKSAREASYVRWNDRWNYARRNCFLFSVGRIGHANSTDWHAVGDSRANGNQLFRRERVGPWHWLLDCLRLGPKRGDLARWSNATMTVRWTLSRHRFHGSCYFWCFSLANYFHATECLATASALLRSVETGSQFIAELSVSWWAISSLRLWMERGRESSSFTAEWVLVAFSHV